MQTKKLFINVYKLFYVLQLPWICVIILLGWCLQSYLESHSCPCPPWNWQYNYYNAFSSATKYFSPPDINGTGEVWWDRASSPNPVSHWATRVCKISLLVLKAYRFSWVLYLYSFSRRLKTIPTGNVLGKSHFIFL